jgi:hypothetical protein
LALPDIRTAAASDWKSVPVPQPALRCVTSEARILHKKFRPGKSFAKKLRHPPPAP